MATKFSCQFSSVIFVIAVFVGSCDAVKSSSSSQASTAQTPLRFARITYTFGRERSPSEEIIHKKTLESIYEEYGEDAVLPNIDVSGKSCAYGLGDVYEVYRPLVLKNCGIFSSTKRSLLYRIGRQTQENLLYSLCFNNNGTENVIYGKHTIHPRRSGIFN